MDELVLQQAIADVINAGVTVIAAAGNDGPAFGYARKSLAYYSNDNAIIPSFQKKLFSHIFIILHSILISIIIITLDLLEREQI